MYVANNEWVLVIYWYIYASNGSLNVRYILVLVIVGGNIGLSEAMGAISVGQQA